jgi:hypothetical protein
MWKESIPGLCGYTEWMQEEILRKNIMVTARKQLRDLRRSESGRHKVHCGEKIQLWNVETGRRGYCGN